MKRACGRCGRVDCPTHQRRERNGSTRQWRALRAQILERDGYRCQECGALATHVDHRVPIVAGGSDHPANLEALCATCNLSKGAQ
jgi:5-methylcytosine-specific restriction endonuclease McrA